MAYSDFTTPVEGLLIDPLLLGLNADQPHYRAALGAQ
jgi:hypothetical protein